jgi:tyrosyl-tRNA synthetase
MTKHPSLALFLRELVDVIPATFPDSLSKKSLNIKFGADPSAPDMHLGHMVVLRKLRNLQDMGHQVTFLIGDFTAMIGDPTGKSETRPILTQEQVTENALTYQTQVFKILDPARTTVVFNATWLGEMSAKDMISLSARHTVARMLERDDFKKRFAENRAISIHEFLYPLLQGYDSVALKSDVEIGGTDQLFNLLMGRHLQREYGQKEQYVVTVPILEGLDGKIKMSKSLGNHIPLLDNSDDMFGKVMSIPDLLITRYFSLLTDVSDSEIAYMSAQMDAGTLNPKHAKEKLAHTLVTMLHDAEKASAAQARFNQIFSKKDIPDDIPELAVVADTVRLSDLIMAQAILPSRKEYQRLVQQGAVSINELPIADMHYQWMPESGDVLRIGKRRFYKIKVTI